MKFAGCLLGENRIAKVHDQLEDALIQRICIGACGLQRFPGESSQVCVTGVGGERQLLQG